MARRTAFSISVDSLGVDDLASRLEGLTATGFAEGTLLAVNRAAERAHDSGKQRILSGINLTEPYVDERLILTRATDTAAPVARISAPIKSTLLTTYGAQFKVKPVRWDNDYIFENKFERIGPNFKRGDWVLRRGREDLGVAEGEKSDGLRVEVLKGQVKSISYAFLVTTKRGQVIPMKRTSSGKVVAAHAPAVYQLFRHTLETGDYIKTVADDLEKTAFSAINTILKGTL